VLEVVEDLDTELMDSMEDMDIEMDSMVVMEDYTVVMVPIGEELVTVADVAHSMEDYTVLDMEDIGIKMCLYNEKYVIY
jgi:hypothetical protein